MVSTVSVALTHSLCALLVCLNILYAILYRSASIVASNYAEQPARHTEKTRRNIENLAMLGIASSSLILKDLGLKLCKIAPDLLIENKGLSWEFGNSLAVRDENTPLVPFTEVTEDATQRTQKPDRLTAVLAS
jgi:hypothetical protein